MSSTSVRGMALSVRVLAAAVCLASATAVAQDPSYTQYWSKVNATKFPGGTFKSSNIHNFPGSSNMSATYVTLYPGGVRELHWHNEVEWAVVLNGTCRATVIESGHGLSETWDYGAGDIWYFRPNEGHMIQGLADGCTYLAGYNSGNFDDMAAPSASSALSSIPSNIAAQGLGIADAANVSNNINTNTFTFMPLGPVPTQTLDEFRSSLSGSAQAVPVAQTHRTSLKNVAYHANTTGGSILLADVAVFPIGAEMFGAIVYFAPGGMRQFHWHTNINEWQFIINGTVEAGVITGPGKFQKSYLSAGDAGYAPKGSAHYIKALGNEPSYAILMFDQGQFTNIDFPVFLSQVPNQVVATSLNSTVAFTDLIKYNTPTMAPVVKKTAA